MTKAIAATRRIVELMNCGDAASVTVTFSDGTYYKETLTEDCNQSMEWTEKDGVRLSEHIEQNCIEMM